LASVPVHVLVHVGPNEHVPVAGAGVDGPDGVGVLGVLGDVGELGVLGVLGELVTPPVTVSVRVIELCAVQ